MVDGHFLGGLDLNSSNLYIHYRWFDKQCVVMVRPLSGTFLDIYVSLDRAAYITIVSFSDSL